MPVGSIDTHYTVGSNGSAYVYNNGAYIQLGNAIFISASQNGETGAGVTSTYSTTFDLTGFNALSATLSGSFGADDAGQVFLNGALIGVSNAADPQYRNLTSFAATSGFLSGLNTLTFSIFNGGGPTGVIVTGLMVDAIATPGPIAGAGIPALLGLAGLMFARRRRSQAPSA